MINLQEVIDKQEQSQMEERLAALFAHVTELKEDLDTARKDLLKSEDVNRKLQQDVHEVSDGSCVCCPEVITASYYIEYFYCPQKSYWMDMNLSKLQELVIDREAWLQSMGSQRGGQD